MIRDNMPRTYKPKPGAKTYKKVDEKTLEMAKRAIASGLSYRKAGEKFGIPKTVLNRHIKNPDTKKQGGQVVLSEVVEKRLVERLITCANWGYPMDTLDLRMIVKSFLDRRGVNEQRFKDNLPGREWVSSFLKRHKKKLSQRMCQNIKRSRANKPREEYEQYFQHLKETLDGVPSTNIMNFDETNLSDDPGRKKVITKRGTKYPERVMNSSKSATSLMYAALADGKVLPPYVVYKAVNMYDTWTNGGPKGARYNRSKSGWFDLQCFSDWFMTIALPHLKKLPGRKLMIGDNLSSHLSLEVIQKCEENDIAFVFLPANSTHMTQPLDVAFFRPMKMAWREILEKWKKGDGRKKTGIPKDIFPSLLTKLTIALQQNEEKNVKAGFAKCGIIPFSPEKVLARLPKEIAEDVNADAQDDSSLVDDSVIDLLKEMRYGSGETKTQRKKKVNVVPGKSVSGINFETDSEDQDSGEDGSTADETTQDSEDDQSSSHDESDTSSDGADDADQSDVTVPSTGDNAIAGCSRSSPPEKVFSKSSFKGIYDISLEDIIPNMPLVVNFASGKGKKFYLGFVEKVLPDSTFEGAFLRPYGLKGNQFVHIDPADIATFTFDQVVGKTGTYGCIQKGQRVVLQFQVDSNQWH